MPQIMAFLRKNIPFLWVHSHADEPVHLVKYCTKRWSRSDCYLALYTTDHAVTVTPPQMPILWVTVWMLSGTPTVLLCPFTFCSLMQAYAVTCGTSSTYIIILLIKCMSNPPLMYVPIICSSFQFFCFIITVRSVICYESLGIVKHNCGKVLRSNEWQHVLNVLVTIPKLKHPRKI